MKNRISMMTSFMFFMIFLSCNPYYKAHTGISTVYLFDEENKTIKISEVENGILQGNNIFITLPDELGGNHAKGNFSYVIELTDYLEINKIYLYSAYLTDSVEYISFAYSKYDSNNRMIKMPMKNIKKYDDYFIKQISQFRYLKMSEQKELYKVYCNFIFPSERINH